jgi:hypothetical protein
LPDRTIEFRQTLAAVLGSIDRAVVAVTIAGPRNAAEAAKAAQAKGWEMFLWRIRSGPREECASSSTRTPPYATLSPP